MTTNAANEISSTTAVVPPPPAPTSEPSRRWVSYLTPVVNSITTAVTNTQNVVEKRLGFCPGKEVLKAASKGLGALGHGLIDLSQVLRKLAGAATQSDDSQHV